MSRRDRGDRSVRGEPPQAVEGSPTEIFFSKFQLHKTTPQSPTVPAPLQGSLKSTLSPLKNASPLGEGDRRRRWKGLQLKPFPKHSSLTKQPLCQLTLTSPLSGATNSATDFTAPKASPERGDSPRGGEMSQRDRGDRSVRGGPPKVVVGSPTKTFSQKPHTPTQKAAKTCRLKSRPAQSRSRTFLIYTNP